MFEKKNEAVKNTPAITSFKWKFVTNNMNMAYMLSSGLIMPPSEFGNKYYQDTLELLPGWIPLFPKAISIQALGYSMQEQPKQLTPCYVELDLKEVVCSAWVYRNSDWQKIRFPDELTGDEDLLLVQAPLPISLIKKTIVFEDKKDAKSFERFLSGYASVDSELFTTSTRKTEFNKKKSIDWPVPMGNTTDLAPCEVSTAAVNAIGGAVASLAALSQSNHHAKHAYQKIVGRFHHVPEEVENQTLLLNFVSEWAYEPVANSRTNDILALVVSTLYDNANLVGQDYGSLLDIILEHFTDISERAFPQNHAALKQAKDLIQLLTTNAQLPSDTVENLLKTYDKSLQQILLSFIFRETITDLLQSPLPIESDREAAVALLVGLKEGWLGLETKFKLQHNCNVFIPNLMAVLAHRFAGNDMQLPNIEAPLLLSEHFSSEKWSKKQQNAAVFLAKSLNWKCVTTRLQLGKGEYELKVTASGLEVILDGEVSVQTTNVDKEKFYEELHSLKVLSSEVNKELRALLGDK